MARKAKKRMHRMPKLSFVDKLIYWTIFLLMVASWGGLFLGALAWRDKIAFADGSVVASDANASFLWILVPSLTWIPMSTILWTQPYQARKPIFGIRNFKYGPPAWPRVYPVFMRNKPQEWTSERKKKQRKHIAILLVLVLLISFLPYPLSLCGRESLCSDGTILEYNMFGYQTEAVTVGDIAEVEIETYRYRTSPARYGVHMVFRTEDGEKYVFDFSDFRDTETSETPFWLETMLQIKELYPSHMIQYDGEESIDRVFEDRNLDVECIEKLYLLFHQ